MRLFTALLTLSAPAGALAAPEPANPESRQAMARYGACIAKAAPELAQRAVVEQWDSREFRQYDLYRIDQCWRRGQIRFNVASMRGAIANALVAGGADADAARVSAAPALTYVMPEPVRTTDDKGRALGAAKIEAQQKAVAGKLNWTIISQFGECVARANPAAVPALARTEVASDAEVAALKAFGPQMPACLPKGVTLELDRSSLRNALVIAYYRLAAEPPGTGPVK